LFSGAQNADQTYEEIKSRKENILLQVI
jgi:hypothetical protein